MKAKRASRGKPKPLSAIARRIIAERDKRGWTDAELSRQLDVPKSQVHDWTHGNHEPTLASLRDIAKVFGTDISDLLSAA